MFVFIKNSATDKLTTIAGSETVPIAWWWERIGEVNGNYVMISVSLMLSWMFYLIVSVVEVISWCLYISGSFEFARFYFSTIGYWGSIIFYAFPWIFALIQLVTKTTLAFPGSWGIFQFMVSLVLWIYTGLVHIFYIDDFVQFIDA